MDQTSPSYRDLYYSWERDQWAAGEIDLSEDRRGWDGLADGMQRRVSGIVAISHLFSERSTQLLVPLVDAAPTEEQQVLLTTEMVDAARHTVFFDRFSQHVLGSAGGDMAARVGGDAQTLFPSLRTLVTEDLPLSTAALHAAPQEVGLFADAVKLYHLRIEAPLVAEQKALVDGLEEADALPGLRAGLTHVSRDGARHLGFARRLLGELEAG